MGLYVCCLLVGLLCATQLVCRFHRLSLLNLIICFFGFHQPLDIPGLKTGTHAKPESASVSVPNTLLTASNIPLLASMLDILFVC